MPLMNGIEAAQRIRELQTLGQLSKSIKIILLQDLSEQATAGAQGTIT